MKGSEGEGREGGVRGKGRGVKGSEGEGRGGGVRVEGEGKDDEELWE